MNTEQIKELISIVEQSRITSFELEEAGYRIRIGKEDSGDSMKRQSPIFQGGVHPALADQNSPQTGNNATALNDSAPAGSANSSFSGSNETTVGKNSENGNTTASEAGFDPNAAKTGMSKTNASLKEIKSPMLGVYYSSPSPDAEAFVKVGDRVKKDDVLCIIEAMKLMNEILAEKDGEIVEICVDNGQIVEFSQTMFLMA